MEKIAEKSCIGFVDVLASKAPVPGGGGAAALVGAIGMALGSMVCNLTTGKKKYAQYEEDIQAILGKAKTLQDQLLEMIDKDAEGFFPLSQAYGLPANTDEEKAAKEVELERCLKLACEVPFKIVELCNESIKLHAKARVNKGLKKKKVYNSNLVWSSSDESLATVNQKGVVTANDNRKTGTVYITARAVNGVKKIIKVDVMNYYNPVKFKNYKVVPEELAPLFGKYKNEMCDIATYFAFDNKISNVKIDLEEDGLSVKAQPEIELNEKIENNNKYSKSIVLNNHLIKRDT